MTTNTRNYPCGIFVGPLFQGKRNARKTAKNLFRLMMSLGVRNTDIGKVIVDPEEGFALVQLRSKEVEDFMVKICKDVRDVLNFFDLRLLTANPKYFKVVRRKAPRFFQQVEMPLPETKTNSTASKIPVTSLEGVLKDSQFYTDTSGESPCPSEFDINIKPAQIHTELDQATWTNSSCSTIRYEFQQLQDEHQSPKLLHAFTSMSASHAQDDGQEEDLVVKVDVKTSTPHVSPCFCPETVFFHQKQYVGSENRHVEFKRGGNLNDHRSFRNVVGKYMCAFLNTEGGTIYFGVTDDGKVVGIEACQKTEDAIRLNIDNAVTMLKPFVHPSAYSVNFAKVMNEDGSIMEDIKVLEICVKPREPPREKYTFNELTYVRRDGSLRTL